MANWMSAQDVFKQLSKNESSVLTGKAIVDYVDDIYKTDEKDVKQAAHRMAEAMAKQGHNAQASIIEIEKEAAKAGFKPEFSYDSKTHQITMRLTRQPGVPGDKGKSAIKPITVKLDIRSPKIGLNKGVPATQSLSAQAEEAGAYFATQLENQLEAIKKTFQARNRAGGSKGVSTGAFNHQINEAVKKSVQSLISHTTHVAVDPDIFSDELYEGDSKSRQLFLQSNLRMAGAINSAIAKVRSQFKTITRKTKKGEELEIDDNYIARAIQTYIMVAQSKLGESAARKTLQNRGIEDGIIDVIKTHLGDILKLSNTANFGSDRSLKTMTISSRGGRENLLGNYGEKSRHAQQGQNYLRKVSRGNRGFEKVFKEINLDSEGFYDDIAQTMYTTAQFDPKSVKIAYDAAKKVIRKEVEQKVRKNAKNKTEDQIQRIIEKRMHGMFGDFDPSVYDDMSIIRKSTLGDLTSIRTRTGSIDERRYKLWEKEANSVFNKKILDLSDENGEFHYGGASFNKTNKDDFIAKYIASKVISGLKPGDIKSLTIDIAKNDGGDIIGYNIIADQLVGAMSQQVKTVTDQGERNYAKGLSDRVFTEMLIQLGINPREAKKIDFIKNKEELKSNNLAHRAIGRLSYIFNKTQDKTGFSKLLRNSPIGQLLKTSNNKTIQFEETPEAMAAFVKTGGLEALYNWMQTNEWDGEKIFDLSAPLIYSHTANLADVFDWNKRVQTGSKERVAQLRTAGASGSTQAYREAIERRYNKTSGHGAQVVKKAQHDIAQIESALYDKTAQTSEMSKKEVSDYIKGKSYKSGSGDFSKRVITMGAGDSYSINTNLFKDIIAQYENGHISESEFAKTWEGEVERLRNELIAQGVDPDDIDVVFDPGQNFGFSDKYGSQYSGRLLHLGSIGANKHIDSLTGETAYDRVDYSPEVNSLMKAIGSRGKNKQSRVSEAVHDVVMGMFKTAESNSGSLNERATKRRLGHSHSFHTSGISPEQIGGDIDQNRLIDSGFISATAMKKLLMDTYDYEDENGNINEEEYLQTLLTQLNAARNSSEEYKEYFDGLENFEDKQKKIVNALMGVAKETGLSGMFNRFPSIDSEAVKNSRLFISESIKDDDIMAVGAGLAKAINADFDGDTINVILKMIDSLAGFFGDKTEQFDQTVIRDVYKMYMLSENSGSKSTDLSEELRKADDEFFNQLSGIAAKVNNINIGTFSNMSTRIRNSLSGTSFDESALIKTDEGVDYNSAKNVAKGLLIKAVGQTLEQDAISSKKVEARISQKFLKLKEEKGSELSQEEKDQIVAETLNEYEELINRIIAGDFTDDADFLKALQEMGIAKNGKIESLGMRTAVSQIKNLGLNSKENISLFKDIFGVDENTARQIMKTGAVETAALGDVMKSVSTTQFGKEHGFFWGDQYHRPVAAAREFGKGTKSDEYELIRLMKYEGYGQNIESVTETNKIFSERGEILREVAGAYKNEIAQEERKIGVAAKEADAINNLGDAWERYSQFIKDTYDIDKSSEDLKSGNFFVASSAGLANIGFQRTTPSKIRNLTNPYTNRTTGVDESFLRGIAPLIDIYKNDPRAEFRASARVKLRNRNALAKQYGIESGAVLDSTIRGAIATTGGDYAASLAQGNAQSIKETRDRLEQLLYALGKTTREVEKELSVFQRAGLGMTVVADHFGTTVGNEIPIATTSENGQYLIGGRMDTVRRSQRQAWYDKNVTEDVYTVLDYKTHKGGEITAEDVSQVLIYQDALQKVQKRLQNEDNSISDEDLLKKFQVEMAAALSGTGLEMGIEGLLNGFTAEDIAKLRKKNTKIESGLVVADSETGSTRAFQLESNIADPVRNLVLGGNWDKYTQDEKSLILSQAQKITQSGYYLKGIDASQTKEQKEADKKAKQEAFNKALEEEYKIRFKIEELKAKQGKAPSEDEKKNYQTLLDYQGTLLKNQEKEVGKVGKGVSSRYKNDLLSAKNAELDLYKGPLKNKGVSGSGPQKQTLLDSLGYNNQNLTRMITQYFSLWRVLGKVQQEIRRVVQITKQLDQAIVNIRIVTGMSREEVDNSIISYNKLAKEIGTTTVALAESANEWLRQGYSISESMDLIEATTKLSKLGMLDMNSATKVLTSTLKGFKMEASEASNIVDKLTKLDMNYAASAGEIGEAMSRTSAIASQMGLSIDETAAMVTTIMDITQQSAEMAGTAVRSILSRYGNVKAGSFVSMMTEGEDLEKINDIEKVLSVLGISIRNSKMEMRDMGEVLDELAKKWNTLSSVEQNAIATAFAGTRQRNQFQVLLSNWNQVREAQEISANAAGTSAEKYEAYMDSIEASIKRVEAAWESYTQKVAASKVFKFGLGGAELLVKNMDKIISSALSYISYRYVSKRASGEEIPKLGIIRNGFSTVGQKLDEIKLAIEKTQAKDAANGSIGTANGKGTQTFSAKARNGKNIDAVYENGKWKSAKTGKEIKDKAALAALDQQKEQSAAEELAREKALKSAKRKAIAASSIMAGITAMIAGPSDTLGISKAITGKDADSVQSNFGDKAAGGVATAGATALLSMIPGIGPIIGSVFGPIVGDILGSLFKTWFHKSELDKKQRVDAAKKELEALNKINSSVKSAENAVYDLSSASAFREAQEAVNALISTLLDDSNNRNEILKKLSEAGLNVKNMDDISRILLGSNNDEKQKLLDITNNYASNKTAEERYKTQEETRAESLKKLDKTLEDANFKVLEGDSNVLFDGFEEYFKEESKEVNYGATGKTRTTYGIAGDTREERAANAKALIEQYRNKREDKNNGLTEAQRETLTKEIEKLEKIVSQYSDYSAENEKLNRELWGDELKAAFSNAGLSTWGVADIARANIEEVVQVFADNLALTGQAVRDYTGAITDSARQQIEAFLRNNDRFSALFTGASKTLNDLINTQREQNELVNKTGAGSYEELRDAFEHNVEKKMEKFAENMLGSSGEMTKAVAELRRQVFKVDTSELEAFANALHMTVGDMLNFRKQLGNVTLADLLKGPAELRESFDDLANIFTSLTTNGKISGEVLEKVNSQYFSLYNMYDEAGEIISSNADNLLKNVRRRLFGSAQDKSTQAFLYQNATFEQLRTNSDFYKSFKQEIKKAIDSGSLFGVDMDKIESATNLNDIIEYIGQRQDILQVLSEYMDDLNMENTYYRELQDKLVEWQKHENQIAIDNLNGQIEALSDINAERKKEIDLIKAKEALENAKKEKQRVYRAGVGWTHETNAEAVSKAQEELESLEKDKTKNDLQYQIDLLEKQNDILDHISENEQLAALKSIFEEYQGYMRTEFGQSVTSGLSSILDFIGTDRTMTWSEYVAMMGKEKAQEKSAAFESYEEARQNVIAQYKNMQNMVRNKSGDELTETQHSAEYIAAQQSALTEYNKMLEAKKTLSQSGKDVSKLTDVFTGEIGKDSEFKKQLQEGLLNERYYYASESVNKKGEKKSEPVRLKKGSAYSNDEISKALELYDKNDSKLSIHRLNKEGKFDVVEDLGALKNGDVVHFGYKDSSGDGSEYAIKDGSQWKRMVPFAKGTLGVDKLTPAIINELGVEGIVTPQGTITSLPAKTGIVPAELTKNLFKLGEVAPNLIKKIDNAGPLPKTSEQNTIKDNSMNFENFYATFNTVEDYDFEKLLINARQYISNTKNLRR